MSRIGCPYVRPVRVRAMSIRPGHNVTVIDGRVVGEIGDLPIDCDVTAVAKEVISAIHAALGRRNIS